MSKFTTQLNSRSIIGRSRLFFGRKVAEVDALAFVHDGALPLLVTRGKCNAVITRSVVSAKAMISGVLRACANAKVLARVIQSVSVPMVNQHVVGRGQNLAVHTNTVSNSIVSLTTFLPCAEGVEDVVIAHDTPMVRAHQWIIGLVNKCKEARIFVAVQGDAYNNHVIASNQVIIAPRLLVAARGLFVSSLAYYNTFEAASSTLVGG